MTSGWELQNFNLDETYLTMYDQMATYFMIIHNLMFKLRIVFSQQVNLIEFRPLIHHTCCHI